MWFLPFRTPIDILISPTQAMCYIPILFSCWFPNTYPESIFCH
jgi:hypothetical protein